MKKVNLVRAVRKAYEQMGYNQWHGGYFFRDHDVNSKDICITMAAAYGAGFKPPQYDNNADTITNFVKQKFNMDTDQFHQLVTLNDKGMVWQEILKELEKGELV